MSSLGRPTHFALGSTDAPVLEGYRVERRLGLGAASTIYLVEDEKKHEKYALKHVVRQDGEDGRMIQQVECEYKVGTQVNHPYIRKIHDIQRRRKRLQVREVFLLMEFCEGTSLEQGPTHSLVDLLLVFRMVADGLNGMHHAGFVHCDIKPNNIIINPTGSIRIIDLGQSCAIGTVKPRIQGTPDYIAPEQVRRKPLGRQTDVFNLGATVYWALTGKNVPTLIPRQLDRVELADEKASGPPASPTELRPKIPIGVSNLVMECIKNDPRERPADMNTVISRLDLLIRMIAGKRLTSITHGNHNP